MEAKHELSNLRRLESIKARKQGRNKQAEQIKASLRNLDSNDGVVLNKKIVFHSDDSDEDKVYPKDEHKKRETRTGSTKLSLFPSDGEDDGDDINQIQIRSQFQGPNGPQFAEESCDPRFQLNNIFMEESNAEDQAVESDDEKQKNLEILESVLGFQLPKNKEPSEAKKKKKYVHFNPEDESSRKYLRKAEPKEEDKTVEKEATATTVSEPQVSPTRYFEVSEDLKSVLQGAEEFRFSKMFNSGRSETNDEEFSMSHTLPKDKPILDGQGNTRTKKPTVENALSLPSTEYNGNEQHHKFFIMPGDARLTEGIEFFKREKSMEEIRENFFKTRELVLEILKKRHRRGLKSPYVVRNKRR